MITQFRVALANSYSNERHLRADGVVVLSVTFPPDPRGKRLLLNMREMVRLYVNSERIYNNELWG